MSTNKTPNLNLHSWEPLDRFTRTEFNDNFDAIDKAAAEHTADIAELQTQMTERPKMVIGSYIGDCPTNTSREQQINLGFRPKVVFVRAKNNRTNGTLIYSTMSVDGYGGMLQGSPEVSINDQGFLARSYTSIVRLNELNMEYIYVALTF